MKLRCFHINQLSHSYNHHCTHSNSISHEKPIYLSAAALSLRGLLCVSCSRTWSSCAALLLFIMASLSFCRPLCYTPSLFRPLATNQTQTDELVGAHPNARPRFHSRHTLSRSLKYFVHQVRRDVSDLRIAAHHRGYFAERYIQSACKHIPQLSWTFCWKNRKKNTRESA